MLRLGLAVRPLALARFACARLRSSVACLSTDSSNQNGAAVSFLEKARRAARERASLRMSSEKGKNQSSDGSPTPDDAAPPQPPPLTPAVVVVSARAIDSGASARKRLVKLSSSEQEAKLAGIDMTPNAGLPEGLTDDAILTFLLETWDAPKTGSPRRKLYKLQRSLDVADVWPLKSTAFDERLLEKEILLSALHRAALVCGVPEFKKGDPNQGSLSMRALASMRSLSIDELRQEDIVSSKNHIPSGRKEFKSRRSNSNWRSDSGRGRVGHQGGGGSGYWQDGRFNDDSGTERDRYGSAWDNEDSRSAGR